MESFVLIKDLYGPKISPDIQPGEQTAYKIENESGNGKVIHYQVFRGIDLFYNDLSLYRCKPNNSPQRDLIEINYCRAGQFACEFCDGASAYLEQGDLAINLLTNQLAHSHFPQSRYQGISITIDIPQALGTITTVSEVLGNLFIDPYAIRDKLCENNTCFIMRAQGTVHRIFSELYTTPDNLKPGYSRIKVLELLHFLSNLNTAGSCEKCPYYSKKQIMITRQVKNHIITHLDEPVTINDLAKKYQIGVTPLKACFKDIYGTTIGNYRKNYKIKAAAVMLQDSDDSIAVISNKVGYKNQSKFASAFKKMMDVSPTDYRKIKD